MVKMFLTGITVDVHESDVDFYKRLGYKVVDEEPAEAAAEEPKAKPVAPEAEPKPKAEPKKAAKK